MVAVAAKVSEATVTIAKVNSLGYPMLVLFLLFFGIVFIVIPKHEGKFLLISHGMSILRVPIQPSPSMPGRPIFVQIFQAAVGNSKIVD